MEMVPGRRAEQDQKEGVHSPGRELGLPSELLPLCGGFFLNSLFSSGGELPMANQQKKKRRSDLWMRLHDTRA